MTMRPVFLVVPLLLVGCELDTSIKTAAPANEASADTEETIDTSVFVCESVAGAPFEFTVSATGSGSGDLVLWLPREFVGCGRPLH